MTDNEIIKSMQCVIGNDVNCSECTYQKVLPFPSCRKMCAKNAIDLINRQQAEIERLQDELIISEGEEIKLRDDKHAYWVLTAEQGDCYDYHVTANCSKCKWEWIGKDDECVGNNRYVFSAFIQGKKELAEQFVIGNARKRKLYNYCPNCGAKMDLGDDEG